MGSQFCYKALATIGINRISCSVCLPCLSLFVCLREIISSLGANENISKFVFKFFVVEHVSFVSTKFKCLRIEAAVFRDAERGTSWNFIFSKLTYSERVLNASHYDLQTDYKWATFQQVQKTCTPLHLVAWCNPSELCMHTINIQGALAIRTGCWVTSFDLSGNVMLWENRHISMKVCLWLENIWMMCWFLLSRGSSPEINKTAWIITFFKIILAGFWRCEQWGSCTGNNNTEPCFCLFHCTY